MFVTAVFAWAAVFSTDPTICPSVSAKVLVAPPLGDNADVLPEPIFRSEPSEVFCSAVAAVFNKSTAISWYVLRCLRAGRPLVGPHDRGRQVVVCATGSLETVHQGTYFPSSRDLDTRSRINPIAARFAW